MSRFFFEKWYFIIHHRHCLSSYKTNLFAESMSAIYRCRLPRSGNMFAPLTLLGYIVKVAVYTWIFDISLEEPSAELCKADFLHLVNDLELNLQFFLRTRCIFHGEYCTDLHYHYHCQIIFLLLYFHIDP